MSRWARLLWLIVIATALLTVVVAIYMLTQEPPPSVPVPSGPPLMRPEPN